MSNYLYMDNKRIAGPVGLATIRTGIAAGTISEETNACEVGDSLWKPVREFAEIAGPSPSIAAAALDLSNIELHYRREFQAIHGSGELYKGSWNWAAFLLGRYGR